MNILKFKYKYWPGGQEHLWQDTITDISEKNIKEILTKELGLFNRCDPKILVTEVWLETITKKNLAGILAE